MKLYQNYKNQPIYEGEEGFTVKIGTLTYASKKLIDCKQLIDLLFGEIELKGKFFNKKHGVKYFKTVCVFRFQELLNKIDDLKKYFLSNEEIKLGFNKVDVKYDLIFKKDDFTVEKIIERLINRAVQFVKSNKNELVLNKRLIFKEDNEFIFTNKKIEEKDVEQMPLRVKVLRDVESLLTKEKINKHGKPEDSFGSIADFWNCFLINKFKTNIKLTAEDVCMMMSLMKHARYIQNPSVEDNIIDIIGYAANAYEQKGQLNEKKGFN